MKTPVLNKGKFYVNLIVRDDKKVPSLSYGPIFVSGEVL